MRINMSRIHPAARVLFGGPGSRSGTTATPPESAWISRDRTRDFHPGGRGARAAGGAKNLTGPNARSILPESRIQPERGGALIRASPSNRWKEIIR
jgi:hypothetical protein